MKKLAVIGEEQESQRWLFPPDIYPDRADLIELVKRGFDHTGERVFSRDEELCRRVVSDLILGHKSQRQIAKEQRVSRNSIAGIREQLERRGLVEPLRKELRRWLGRNALMMLEEIGSALAEGTLHPAQLSVPLAIHMQHLVALESGNGLGDEGGARPKGLRVEDVREALENMKRASVVKSKTTDSESVA